jgi:hypothetical protein
MNVSVLKTTSNSHANTSTHLIPPLGRPESIRVLDLVHLRTSLRKQKRHTRTFDCNRTKTDTKRVSQIIRQHQMHTPTRVLTGIHHSNDHSLSDYSNWYTYRRVCVSESDTLKRLTAIEPQQKIQNECVSSEDNIKCTRQHEYSPNSTTRTTRVYQSTRPGTLTDEYT